MGNNFSLVNLSFLKAFFKMDGSIFPDGNTALVCHLVGRRSIVQRLTATEDLPRVCLACPLCPLQNPPQLEGLNKQFAFCPVYPQTPLQPSVTFC